VVQNLAVDDGTDSGAMPPPPRPPAPAPRPTVDRAGAAGLVEFPGTGGPWPRARLIADRERIEIRCWSGTDLHLRPRDLVDVADRSHTDVLLYTTTLVEPRLWVVDNDGRPSRLWFGTSRMLDLVERLSALGWTTREVDGTAVTLDATGNIAPDEVEQRVARRASWALQLAWVLLAITALVLLVGGNRYFWVPLVILVLVTLVAYGYFLLIRPRARHTRPQAIEGT